MGGVLPQGSRHVGDHHGEVGDIGGYLTPWSHLAVLPGLGLRHTYRAATRLEILASPTVLTANAFYVDDVVRVGGMDDSGLGERPSFPDHGEAERPDGKYGASQTPAATRPNDHRFRQVVSRPEVHVASPALASAASAARASLSASVNCSATECWRGSWTVNDRMESSAFSQSVSASTSARLRSRS